MLEACKSRRLPTTLHMLVCPRRLSISDNRALGTRSRSFRRGPYHTAGSLMHVVDRWSKASFQCRSHSNRCLGRPLNRPTLVDDGADLYSNGMKDVPAGLQPHSQRCSKLSASRLFVAIVASCTCHAMPCHWASPSWPRASKQTLRSFHDGRKHWKVRMVRVIVESIFLSRVPLARYLETKDL